MKNDIIKLMRLLQFTDSTLPVGAFSFSNGLETASHQNIVFDAATLEAYVKAVAIQAAYSDGIAALHAHRATLKKDYDELRKIDNYLLLFKMNDESRQMLRRMGKKMVELSTQIIDEPFLTTWLNDIKQDKSPGTYPVAQGVVFALMGLTEEELFSSHQYGVINMVLSAALRCVKVSHYDTQKILFALNEQSQEFFDEIKTYKLDEMNTFVPQIDILSSLHEKGNMRMFMN